MGKKTMSPDLPVHTIENCQPSCGAERPKLSEMHLWLVDLTRPGVRAWLSEDEQQRAERFLIPRVRERFVAARAALRGILGAYLGIAPESLEFLYGEHGKPSLANPAHQLQFNLSHAEDMAMLAVAERSPLGLDLEPLREVKDALRIAQRILPESAVTAIETAPEGERSTYFLYHWTALEARAKLHGGAVFQPHSWEGIETLHLAPRPGWLACLARERHSDIKGCQSFLWSP